MGENSKIEWTTHTFNPWIGCTKVAAGCTHCYAETFAKRTGKAKWGPEGTRVKTSEAYWKKPLEWNKRAMVWPLHEELCRQSGVQDPILEWERQDNGQLPDPALMRRPRVFCASMADVFEDWKGPIMHHGGEPLCIANRVSAPAPAWRPVTMDDVRSDLFKLIDATPHLDWLLLTKRPENIRRMWPSADMFDRDSEHKANWPNVWLLTSIAEQPDADANVPHLLNCRDLVPVLGLSCEPLIGPVDLSYALPSSDGFVATEEGPIHIDDGAAHINWVIVGGESGHGARPCDLKWIRGIRDQCKGAGVPVFVKQLGKFPIDEGAEDVPLNEVIELPDFYRVASIDDPKGGDWNEWPKDLRVRQFPEVAR